MAALAGPSRRIAMVEDFGMDPISEKPKDFGVDPISEEPIVDPVIDECGHTFNRSTVQDFIRRTPEGSPVLCPFSRQVIHTNKLVVNRFANQAVQHVHALEARIERLEDEVKEANIKQEKSNRKFEMMFEHLLAEKEDAIRREKESVKARNKVEKAFLECHQRLNFLEDENQKLKQKNEQLARDNKVHIGEVADLKKSTKQFNNNLKAVRRDLQSSKQKSQRVERQMKNLDNMSTLDRIFVVLDPITGYRHLDSVKNRGLLAIKG